MIPPFDEDSAVCKLAEALELEVSRFEAIEVTDLKALKAAGLTKTAADYTRIRALLLQGTDVPGAKLGSVEYKLRRPA